MARQLEELMLAAGMPASYTKDEFGQWHARLYATDETYRDGHRQLMAMVKAKRAQ